MPFPDPFVAGHVVTADELEAMRQFGDTWDTYAVSWSATTTAPTVGSGTLTGRYVTYGQLVKGRVELTVGGGGLGSGTYTFSLPVAAANLARTNLGTASFYDASGGFYAGIAYLSSTSSSLMSLVLNNAIWTPAAPVAPASGDIISVTFEYEAAA